LSLVFPINEKSFRNYPCFSSLENPKKKDENTAYSPIFTTYDCLGVQIRDFDNKKFRCQHDIIESTTKTFVRDAKLHIQMLILLQSLCLQTLLWSNGSIPNFKTKQK
jgi:hypothetical protein